MSGVNMHYHPLDLSRVSAKPLCTYSAKNLSSATRNGQMHSLDIPHTVTWNDLSYTVALRDGTHKTILHRLSGEREWHQQLQAHLAGMHF